MWICRDENGHLHLFAKKPQMRYSYYYECMVWHDDALQHVMLLEMAFPEVTFENSPMEVELKLIEK